MEDSGKWLLAAAHAHQPCFPCFPHGFLSLRLSPHADVVANTELLTNILA
jgi:hypothetical protein